MNWRAAMAAAAAMAACATGASAAESVSLTVSAAISLKDALEEARRAFAEKAPQVEVVFNFGSSGSLLHQIENGAPVDLFISAAATQMDALEAKRQLVEGTRRDLLQNSLVLVVPDGAAGPASFEELAGAAVTRIAVGEPKTVPAGQYAAEVLAYFRLSDAVQNKLVFARDVRQVLTYVESGNVDAGLVYLTDAKSSAKVKVAATAPAESHAPIVYPAAVIASTRHAAAAKAFLDFLGSAEAKAIFASNGFAEPRTR